MKNVFKTLFKKDEAPVTPAVPVVRSINVLNKTQYDKIESKFGRVGVNSTTSDLEAGYMLGAQAVLKELRDGFTQE